MTTIPIIILRLTGPMQSWGINSRWNFRDTSTEPTKSGIIGLLPVLEILSHEYSSLKEALKTIPWNKLTSKGDVPEMLRCVIEDEKGNLLRKDAIRINPARIYGTRRISEYWVETPIIE